MKLSEAILLGDTLRTRNHTFFLCQDLDGGVCGCALGGAALALGLPITWGEWYQGTFLEMQAVCPWVDFIASCEIGERFIDVTRGKMSLEKLIDYVRSIEPACECNRFNCDCATKKAEEVQAEYVTTT